MLGEVAETRDALGEVDHVPHGGREALGELLPDLLARLAGVHVGGRVHGTDLEQKNTVNRGLDAPNFAFQMQEYLRDRKEKDTHQVRSAVHAAGWSAVTGLCVEAELSLEVF